MTSFSENTFRTSDTALAAFLISEGFDFPDIDFVNGNQAFFVFSRTQTNLETAIIAFDTARAKGNIVLFFNAYQNLIRRIKER